MNIFKTQAIWIATNLALTNVIKCIATKFWRASAKVEWISVLAIFGIHGVVDISFGSRSNGQGEDARHQISRQAVTNASECI